MTQKAIEALTAKLIRIWQIKSIVNQENYLRFGLEAPLEEGVMLSYSRYHAGGLTRVALVQRDNSGLVGRLYWNSNEPEVMGIGWKQSDRENEFFEPFARAWMPFFRRSCWLSGCDIEASVHEKLEWLDGITAEEIREWNLRLNEYIEKELARIVAAFGVTKCTKVRQVIANNFYKATTSDGQELSIRIDNLGKCSSLSLGGCALFNQTNLALPGQPISWAINLSEGESDLIMARGLYRLGFDDEAIFSQLPLTAHEKLELRLSTPRELWPQVWLDEESERLLV
ncbi:hypothetical protein EON83_26855 [bacterium]|nr:MAG: hypothetical protein EON83_26855 [bacterium]